MENNVCVQFRYSVFCSLAHPSNDNNVLTLTPWLKQESYYVLIPNVVNYTLIPSIMTFVMSQPRKLFQLSFVSTYVIPRILAIHMG